MFCLTSAFLSFFHHLQVLFVDPANRKLLLTHKKSLVDSTMKPITSYSKCTKNEVIEGCIVDAKSSGAVVAFYNNIKVWDLCYIYQISAVFSPSELYCTVNTWTLVHRFRSLTIAFVSCESALEQFWKAPTLRGWRRFRSSHQLKGHPRLPSTSHYKVLLCLLPYGRNSNAPSLTPKGRKWYQSKCGLHIPIHTIGLSCTIWPQYTAWQTDQNGLPML